MNARATRRTVEGRAYLDLQNLARRSGRPTDELHQLYALEGFIDRLTRSGHAERFVLKGALLLAAFDSRRPTRDIDLAARALANDAGTIREVVDHVVEVEVDDGLRFEPSATRAEVIRDGDDYSGVRITVQGGLAVARLQFHVDVNVGDPIVPRPGLVRLPRLLGGELCLAGYPLVMVLAEKIVTAVQRGRANTRWRDFVDISRLAAAQPVNGDQFTVSILRVAEHRHATIEPLADVLDGFADEAQTRWWRWRRKLRLEETTPEAFGELLAQVVAFADPVLLGEASGRIWNPAHRSWQ